MYFTNARTIIELYSLGLKVGGAFHASLFHPSSFQVGFFDRLKDGDNVGLSVGSSVFLAPPSQPSLVHPSLFHFLVGERAVQ